VGCVNSVSLFCREIVLRGRQARLAKVTVHRQPRECRQPAATRSGNERSRGVRPLGRSDTRTSASPQTRPSESSACAGLSGGEEEAGSVGAGGSDKGEEAAPVLCSFSSGRAPLSRSTSRGALGLRPLRRSMATYSQMRRCESTRSLIPRTSRSVGLSGPHRARCATGSRVGARRQGSELSVSPNSQRLLTG
jgi:hypothetical protein